MLAPIASRLAPFLATLVAVVTPTLIFLRPRGLPEMVSAVGGAATMLLRGLVARLAGGSARWLLVWAYLLGVLVTPPALAAAILATG